MWNRLSKSPYTRSGKCFISYCATSTKTNNNVGYAYQISQNQKKISATVQQQQKIFFTTASSIPYKENAGREPVVPHRITPSLTVPAHIPLPPYALTGHVPHNFFDTITIHSSSSILKMRNAAKLARKALDYACSLVPSKESNLQEGGTNLTTNDIDVLVHEYILQHNAYPSPLNYAGFPKSLCSSVNEVICHGIPDCRELQYGDIVSFDVSVYLDGVHGDNCATVIVGDTNYTKSSNSDSAEDEFVDDEIRSARRLVKATQESLNAAIQKCKPGGCLSEIGEAIEAVTDKYNYSSVRAYRGHGIGEVFHCAPYVKHFRNKDKLELKPGMIFTIEPMVVEGAQDCKEWESDGWTVATLDRSRAAQFEHTVLITDGGVEILTLP